MELMSSEHGISLIFTECVVQHIFLLVKILRNLTLLYTLFFGYMTFSQAPLFMVLFSYLHITQRSFEGNYLVFSIVGNYSSWLYPCSFWGGCFWCFLLVCFYVAPLPLPVLLAYFKYVLCCHFFLLRSLVWYDCTSWVFYWNLPSQWRVSLISGLPPYSWFCGFTFRAHACCLYSPWTEGC